MRYGLKDEAIDAINAVFAQYPSIEKVVLYGSRARGDFGPGSDVDLTIVEHGLTLDDLFRIENQLDDLLLPYTFDLSLQRQLDHPALIEHIRSVGAEFYTAAGRGP